jgi:putative nucleotidyltransferase with HDIG domain
MQADADNKLASEMERILLGRIATGRVSTPGMPAVSTKCMAALRDPRCSAGRLAGIIESDPLLATQVLRAANSAANGASNIRTLEQAVNRIGNNQLKVLCVEYGAKTLFESNNKRIAEANRRLWDHSLAVALLARDIAALIGASEPDTCYLAGLLHDIGKPIVGAMLLEAERQLGQRVPVWLDHTAWSGIVNSIHRKVGSTLATTWKLAPEISAAIVDASDYDPGDRKGVGNIVRFANAIAKREGYVAGPIDADDIEAMIMVGQSMIGADEELVNRLTSGLKGRVAPQDA